MCLSKACFKSDAAEEPIMENIARVRVEGDVIVLRSLFGEEKRIEARLEEIDFTHNSILLQKK